jgi:hypothetical protein
MATFSVPSSTPQRINSVNEGINEIKNADHVKQAVSIFTEPSDSFVKSSVSLSKSTNISAEAAIQAPTAYYRQLPAVQNESVNANELQKTLNDPQLNVAHGLDSLVKTMGDMSELEKFDLQRMYQDYQQGVNLLSNMIKLTQRDKENISQNIKV